ncbi:MAG: hypothetical protein LBH06_04410 [Rikenellaceae bacterium]|nr:hypothetical protein [Rikenellaceae bacterium]
MPDGCHQGYYSCFVPEPIDRQWALDDVEIINLLGKAERAIGKLDMFSEYVPNIDLFIRMHVIKEATQSAKIEGTQTNLEEALRSRDEIPQDKRDDWDEVQNYIRALWLAMEKMDELPFSGRLIKTIHKTLLQGVRGEHRFQGEFRTSQLDRRGVARRCDVHPSCPYFGAGACRRHGEIRP